MKIGIVLYPTFGGSGVMATELGLGLAEKGHEVHFITYQEPARLNVFSPNIYYHEVSVPQYPLFEYPPYETALASTLVNVVKHKKLDILHVHYAIPHASSAYLAQQMLKAENIHIPFITTLHGTDITLVGKDSSYRSVVTFSINQSNAITAVSENLKLETYKFFDVHKEIEVIHNFVDLERFKKNDLTDFKKQIAPKGEKIITHVSNFRPVKRIQDVVHAFAKIQERVPAKLLMVGDGPDRQLAEELCRKLGTCKHTRFLGKQEKMEDIFNISDLFILPSTYESFGLAALEAMACGVPVISTNTGGLPEINLNGSTGFLTEIGDIETMSEKSIYLLGNDKVLNEFKENAMEHAKKFSLKDILPKYESLYLNVINNK
ncbi:MAG TPA: N-acetyl-alpha-D-glucosaminyl L-malate synthase BshA [Chitinophagaceae bacterium]|nr:N-acetyl-alpha-D-glucosaminyl L-malate synthase BshA [Chitinophagaceae bacterium]